MKRLLAVLTVLSLALGASPAFAKNWNFSIGTSTLGGSMQIMATPLTKLISDKVPNTYASVQNTPGPQSNLQMMEIGEMQMAFCSTPVAYQGLTGTGWAKGKKYENFRTMLVVFPSYFQFVTKESTGIKTFRDLEGKRVHTSIPGTTPDITIQAACDVLGITFKEKHPLNTGPASDMLRDGRVDAVSCTMGIPTPFIMDLQATLDGVHLVNLDTEDQNAIANKYPYLAKTQIPAGTYKGQTDSVNTFAVWNFVMVHKDVPEDLVYEITKVALSNLPEFAAAASIGKDFKAENIQHAIGLIHPGSARYYKEIGIHIPEDRIGR